MVFQRRSRKWIVFSLVAIALVPIILTTYEVIFTVNNSVIFLEKYNPNVVFIIISYYVLLLCLGVSWVVRQLIVINKLKNEKLKAELMLLKSQVSPHFFFNMLNNLYGLVTKDSQKAQELILKLSEMMRYSIYEGEKETVTIKEEIDFLKNYIELHKMRYHKQITIDFNCNVNESLKVTPLLFIILLENAFKHGAEKMRVNAYIKINLTTSKSNLHFTIENNYEKTENQSGIGLKNLKRRLELLYPNQHEFTSTTTESVYQTQLILKLL